MKKIKIIALFAFIFITNNLSAQSTFEKWPAIKTFHGVMSQTFHPAEEGNLEPIKTRSEEMVQKANALSTSEIPAEFKTTPILASIESIQQKSKVLHQMVLDKVTDVEITKSLSELHDVFHEIVGLCSAEKH